MKTIAVMLALALLVMIISLAQYFLTGIPGKYVFFPTVLVTEILYLVLKFSKK